MALINTTQREQIVSERMADIDLGLKHTGAPALRPDQRIFVESAINVAVRHSSAEAARFIKSVIGEL